MGATAIIVCDEGPALDLLEGEGSAVALVHPGVGALARAMHRIGLPGGAATIKLSHPSDAVYYVLAGTGAVRGGREDEIGEGSMIHIDAGTQYEFLAGATGLAVVGGPAPADPALYGAGTAPARDSGLSRAPEDDGIRLFHRDRPDLLMPLISSDARLVVWPGVGAHAANMNYVAMAAGEENVPHAHANSEDTIYILEGRGTVRNLDDGTVQSFSSGQAIFVPAAVQHQVRADAGVRVVSVGGPCPPDYEMLHRLGAEFDAP